MKKFIGWICERETKHNEVLKVKMNGITKSEVPASIVYNMCNHMIVFPMHQIYIKDNDKIEFLFDDKPLPDDIKPILVVGD